MKTEAEFVAAILRYFGLNEALRSDQSNEELRDQLAAALNDWAGRPADRVHVMYTFSDRLIAYAWNSRDDGSIDRGVWEIQWSTADGKFTFGPMTEVKAVTVFEPMAESKTGTKGNLGETVEQPLSFSEAASNGSRKVKAVGITADVVNGNGRRYPRAVLAQAVANLNGHLHESNGQGRLIATGEAEHPSDKGGRPNLLETVVKWSAASLDSTGKVLLEGVILPTTKGKDILTLVEHRIPVGVSMRGYGSFNLITESGQTIQEVTELTIKGFDLVAQPSDPNGQIVENQQADKKEKKKVTLEELLKLLEDKPELKESIMKQFGFTDANALAEKLGVKSADAVQRKLDEALKAQAELEERKRQDEIDKAIDELAEDLPYDDGMNKRLVESVKARNPKTAAEVSAIFEEKRKEYDEIAAQYKLAEMGKRGKGDKGGVRPTVEWSGPTFERETGLPEFVKPAYLLTESVTNTGHGRKRDWSKVGNDSSRAEIFAKLYLKRFDENYRHEMIAESRRFEEAEQTSDLNLPYTVMRTIIEIAWPELIAANVFDFGVMQGNPELLFFEAYAGESGATATVTAATVTGDHGVWVALAQKRLRPGTVTLTNSGATVTYTEGTDYVLNYADGQIMTISTGLTTDGQSLRITYTYDAIRKGEMGVIERGKNTLSNVTLTAVADRLGVQISTEAVLFSRSQLGYDAVGRTLSNIMREVRRRIDNNILYNALSACLRQANNSGGTWASSSDAITLFVSKLGVTKTKVHNRFYVPDAIVMSVTNADRLSNWDGFTRLGFPNATLNAAGFAGGVKGLPIFASPEFSDGYAMVVNRELVMHRVYQAMQLKGPFPSIDGSTGQLIAADQYYVEEFNNTSTPVVEKGAYMVIS